MTLLKEIKDSIQSLENQLKTQNRKKNKSVTLDKEKWNIILNILHRNSFGAMPFFDFRHVKPKYQKHE